MWPRPGSGGPSWSYHIYLFIGNVPGVLGRPGMVWYGLIVLGWARVPQVCHNSEVGVVVGHHGMVQKVYLDIGVHRGAAPATPCAAMVSSGSAPAACFSGWAFRCSLQTHSAASISPVCCGCLLLCDKQSDPQIFVCIIPYQNNYQLISKLHINLRYIKKLNR